jgi:hypothetical protein
MIVLDFISMSCRLLHAHTRFSTRNFSIGGVFLVAGSCFFNLCFLRYYLSKPLTSLSCSMNAVFPGLKMWDTLAFDCFDFKVRPGTPGLTNNPALHSQSNLKSPQTTCYCNFFLQLYSAIATCPRTQGYIKEPLFLTKRRFAGAGNRTSAHLPYYVLKIVLIMDL